MLPKGKKLPTWSQFVPEAVIICFILGLFSYLDSIKIMRGDYLFSRWMLTVETNKSWFMLFFWLLIGITIPVILVMFYRKQKNKRKGN
jgi:uncharacterized membrane protein